MFMRFRELPAVALTLLGLVTMLGGLPVARADGSAEAVVAAPPGDDALEADNSEPAAPEGAPEAEARNPFQVQAPRREGDSFVRGGDPEASIPDAAARTKDPLLFGYFLMELTDKAVAAFEAKDYAQAVKFYRAMAKAVPDRATPWSKLCEISRITGDSAQAELLCREAMRRHGTVVGDHTAFVSAFLENHPGSLPSTTVAELDRIILHVASIPDAALDGARVGCLLATRLNDVERLKKCSNVMNTLLPHDPQSISYSWALAVAEGDRTRAEQELERARAAGMPEQALVTMRERGESLIETRNTSRLRVSGLVGAGVATLAAVGTYLARRRRSLAHA